MGNGMIPSDWMLAVLTLLCLLAHLAVLRAPDIPETPIIVRIRFVKIAGFLIMTLRWWYVMLTEGDLLIPIASVMGLSLLFFAEFYGTVYRLFETHINDQKKCREMRRAAHRKASHAAE